MARPLSEVDNLSATLEWRFNDIWGVYDRGDHEDAEAMAEQLLMEPYLSSVHRAGLHLLLAASPTDYVDHARQAVRLYNEVLQGHNLSPEEQFNVRKMLGAAESALSQARRDQSAVTREVDKILASGKTMTDLHDIQMKELNDQLLEEGLKGDGDFDTHDEKQDEETQGNAPETSLPSSQSVPLVVLPSSQSVQETAGNSQGSDANMGRSQSTALTDLDDDTQPLPSWTKSEH